MNRIIFICSVIIVPLLLGACSKDDSVTPKITITEDEVADMLGTAMAESTGGFCSHLAVVTHLADSGAIGSNRNISAYSVPAETTITRSWSLGLYNFNYSVTYGYSLMTDSLAFHYSMKGGYNTPRISSNDSAYSQMTVSQILDSIPPWYLISGTYLKTGSHASKVGERKQYTSTLAMIITDVHINKTSKQIQYGTLNIAVNGSSSDGKSFSYTGILTFLGNRQASLILNDVTYLIGLGYGDVERLDEPQIL